MNLTVIIATRGRPELLLETVGHTVLNMAKPSTRLLVCVDHDDFRTLAALNRLPTDDRITCSIKPREDSRGEKYDRALTEAKADIYLPAVDYAPILTPGFDQAIVNAAQCWPDQIGIVCTPMIDEIIPGLQAITAKLAEKLGGIYSHDYPFWFIDHELMDIAAMIDRIAFVDVDVDFSKRPQKTHRLRDLWFWTLYYDAMSEERRLKARAIIDSPEFAFPEWHKAQIREYWQLVQARSLDRHGRVRAQAHLIEASRGVGGIPDEGYVRLFTKAKAKIDHMIEQQAA